MPPEWKQDIHSVPGNSSTDTFAYLHTLWYEKEEERREDKHNTKGVKALMTAYSSTFTNTQTRNGGKSTIICHNCSKPKQIARKCWAKGGSMEGQWLKQGQASKPKTEANAVNPDNNNASSPMATYVMSSQVDNRSSPVPVPLYLLTIWISLYSLFCYLCFSTLVSHLYGHLYDPIYAFTSHLSNPSESLSSPNVYPFGEPTSPKPPQAPPLLHKLWDLDLGNVKAIPYTKLRVASPLLPPPLEDVNRYPTSQDLLPGLILYWELSHLKPTSITIYNDPTLTFLASTTHTTPCSYIYWFPLIPPSSVNVLGTSLDLLGTPSRVTSRISN
ncbi:hypothetical protein F5876DRAFT_81661 [Lentinula aff. lateritia]|uniref:Uncharacterized protein n=1 Tax=Lentinula aff. lateritia TaxID=2804960 RepID=A0ACC1TLF4_9AGAR|nr:hypothetical protein F5876DRAFT_81661 [Lentinula aff. lateritia]